MENFQVQNLEKFQATIKHWFGVEGRQFPWRQTSHPMKIIIAETILRQTGAWKGENAYNRIVNNYGSIEELANAHIDELKTIFQPLGLHSRAELLVNISRDLLERFGGIVPETYVDLISIKRIGTISANAVLCFAFDRRVPLVDGSISRIFCRSVGYQTQKKAYADKELWDLAFELVPHTNYREYNLGLLHLGALVCKHTQPHCSQCPIADDCISSPFNCVA